MADGVKRRGECLPEGCCPSTQQWREQRLIFDMFDAGGALLSPTVSTDLGVARADGNDPGIAIVSLHNIASVREITISQNTPTLDEIRNAARSIPIGTSYAPALNAAVSARNTGRGFALPQFRVTFRDGSPDGATVYVDGNCVVSHPGDVVKIEALTPPLDYNGVGPVPAGTGAGLVVDATVAWSAAWGEKEGDAGPFGMATWTQSAEGVGGTPMVFRRPPFARRVVVIPPIGVGSIYDFRMGDTNVLATPPAVANSVQQPQDVPGGASHLVVTLAPAAPAGTPVTVIWEIGVR